MILMISRKVYRLTVFAITISLLFLAASVEALEAHHPLSFGDRVHYQRALEEVYWRHRTWPAENKGLKPSLSEMMPDALIREKVRMYLKQSNLLAEFWQHPIGAADLQAEIQRMVNNSKQPALLEELFSALDNDPHVIAECLARPELAGRLAHNMFAADERIHGDLKSRIQAELALTQTAAAMPALSGTYFETTWQKSKPDGQGPAAGAYVLDPAQWKERIRHLELEFGASASLPLRKVSSLQEDSSRYYVESILEAEDLHLRISVVEWPKHPFESWWGDTQKRYRVDIEEPAAVYSISAPTTKCRNDSWTPTFSGVPSARNDHQAVWTGTEMIVWGGSDGSLTNTGGRYSPATDSWAPGAITSTGAPRVRRLDTAIWTGTEMIIWGGNVAVYSLNDGGRYNPVTDTWTPVTITNAPTGRTFHHAIWTGTEMIIWGGSNGSNELNSGGRYNPSTDTWAAGGTSLTNAPTGLGGSSAVWTGTEMIIWGGNDGTNNFNTGGRYNPSTDTWAAAGISTVNAPSGRYSQSAVWTGTEMIIWGGHAGNALNTGGRYNPATDTWNPAGVASLNAPTARYFAPAFWTGSQMLIWGGHGGANTGGLYNPATDTWTAGGTSMTNAPSNTFMEYSAVWTGSEMILWGGSFAGVRTNYGARYNPSTNSWFAGGTDTTMIGDGRTSTAGVWTGNEMIVWGGLKPYSSVPTNSGAIYYPATDSWLPGGASIINAPLARYWHSMVWNGTQAIVWGGWDQNSVYLNTGGRYDPTTNTWNAAGTNLTNAPSGRVDHNAIWTGSRMIIWSGYTSSGRTNTGARYDPTANTWSTMSITNVPTAGTYSAVWTGSQMLVWSGIAGGKYNPSSNSWTAAGISTSNAPSSRDRFSAVWTGSEMIIWGGEDQSTDMNTGGRYNPATNLWVPGGTSTVNAPAPRHAHIAVWDGSEMLIWSGGTNAYLYLLNSGGRYDPTSNSWLGVSTATGVPSARYDALAFWTGTEMLVWGGLDDMSSPMNSGGRYCTANACGTILVQQTAVPGSTMLPQGVVGSSYSTSFTASGGVGPYTYSTDGNLPAGLTLSTSGLLSGTPTVAANAFSVRIAVTDANGCQGLQLFTLTILPSGFSCIFCDDFNDGDYTNPAWTLSGKGNCNAATGDAVCTTSGRLDLISPDFGGCTNCTLDADVNLNTGGSVVTLFGWYLDKNHWVALILKHDKNQVILKQKFGMNSAKVRTNRPLALAISNFQVSFNGSIFQVSINGSPIPQLTLSPIGPPSGNFRFRLKSPIGTPTASLVDLRVY